MSVYVPYTGFICITCFFSCFCFDFHRFNSILYYSYYRKGLRCLNSDLEYVCSATASNHQYLLWRMGMTHENEKQYHLLIKFSSFHFFLLLFPICRLSYEYLNGFPINFHYRNEYWIHALRYDVHAHFLPYLKSWRHE